MNGKGSTPRPVNRKKYDANFLAIRWPSKLPTHSDKCSENCRKKSKISVDGKRGI